MTYSIHAALYTEGVIPSCCIPAITRAEALYNAVPRANGKRIQAKLSQNGTIDLTLHTTNPVPHPLVAAQGLSKLLSLEPSFAAYICPGRLLKST